jgi:phosphopantothenoylcysteine decarboxylase / phosphopantothenate---cysteine ligase
MRILITAGPTREYLDTVRFITNASSGLTGYLTAAAAQARGHRVILIAGPTACEKPKGVKTKLVPVVSALDMYREVKKYYPKVDAVIMTAAVGDYRPARISAYKLKKSGQKLSLDLVPTPDILAELGRSKKNQRLIGFALEDRSGKTNALKKFNKKNLDAIILNSPSALGSRKNQVRVYTPQTGWQTWPTLSKTRLAQKIIILTEHLATHPKKGS